MATFKIHSSGVKRVMLTGPHKELKNLSGEGLLRAENFIHSVVLFILFIYEFYSYSICAYLSDVLNGP